MGEKRNPIDSIRAVAAAELATAAAGMITGARLSELDRGIGGWHAEWVALPLAFQATAATVEAMTTCLGSVEVEAGTMSARVAEAGPIDQRLIDGVLAEFERVARTPMTTSGRTGTLTWYTVGRRIGATPGHDPCPRRRQRDVGCPTPRALEHEESGDGGSPRARQLHGGAGPYTIRDLGEDILDVATTAGADEFDLCGMSLGGLISLWMAGHSPERVMSLIASNTAARIGSEEIWQARIDAVTEGGMEAVSEQALARFFTSSFASEHPEVFDRTSRALLATDPGGYAACCAALRDADLRELVEAIRCPTLVIGGSEDISTPPDAVGLAARAHPGQHASHPGGRPPFRQSRTTPGVDGGGQRGSWRSREPPRPRFGHAPRWCVPSGREAWRAPPPSAAR